MSYRGLHLAEIKITDLTSATNVTQAPVMGWGADFLKKSKESEAQASAAAAAAIEEAQGAAKGRGLRTINSIGVGSD